MKTSKNIVLEKGSFIFRPYKVSDFKAMTKALEKRLPLQNQYDYWGPLGKDPSLEDFKAKLKKVEERRKNNDYRVFGIFHRDGSFVGQMDFKVINAEMNWVNLGLFIHNNYWGKGYGLKLTKLGIELAFNRLGIYRLEAGTEIKNVAAKKVLDKSKMNYEGIRKKFFPRKKCPDMHFYAITNPKLRT